MSLRKQPSTISNKRNSLSSSQHKQIKPRGSHSTDPDGDLDDLVGVCKSVYISQLNDINEEITTSEELMQCK